MAGTCELAKYPALYIVSWSQSFKQDILTTIGEVQVLTIKATSSTGTQESFLHFHLCYCCPFVSCLLRANMSQSVSRQVNRVREHFYISILLAPVLHLSPNGTS